MQKNNSKTLMGYMTAMLGIIIGAVLGKDNSVIRLIGLVLVVVGAYIIGISVRKNGGKTNGKK